MRQTKRGGAATRRERLPSVFRHRGVCWYAPISVILAVPLSLLGPMAVLTGLRIENNLYTQIGLILLIALSAKNAILIVEVALELHVRDGKPILESAVEAARARFRPILMTSFAFILGVVPLVTAT